tara:strand:+ start:57 stop:482 length:426 start_codon:yes stop_codon:yes gene_type:complete
MNSLISDIIISKENKITVPDGDIYHALKKSDIGFNTFGEAYFSFIKYNKIKAWKKHRLMTLNLLVPIGSVKFVFFDNNKFKVHIIGQDHYFRLTVPPGIWFGFQGLSKGENLIINIADINHSDKEVEKKNIDQINYEWKKY